jgi:clumping factor A
MPNAAPSAAPLNEMDVDVGVQLVTAQSGPDQEGSVDEVGADQSLDVGADADLDADVGAGADVGSDRDAGSDAEQDAGVDQDADVGQESAAEAGVRAEELFGDGASDDVHRSAARRTRTSLPRIFDDGRPSLLGLRARIPFVRATLLNFLDDLDEFERSVPDPMTVVEPE